MRDNGYNLSVSFTDSQLADIVLLRAQGIEWEKLAREFNKKHKANKTVDAIKHAYRKYGSFFESDSDTVKIAHLKEIQRVKRTNSKTARENKTLLDYLNRKQGLLEDIEELTKKLPKVLKKSFKRPQVNKTKKNMTLELMLSDIHYGKETKTFNLEVCRKRMRELVQVLFAEIERASKLYNIDRLIIALLGDIIESATMHGLESAKGSEFGNPKQIQSAIESLYLDVLLPVSLECGKRGIQIDVPAVTGNHDREDENRTFHNPGEENVTWIIYNTLRLLCEASGLKNIKFHIAEGPYIALDIYGNTALYEHGDNTAASTRKACQALLNDRQTQLKKIIHFLRLGHYHEYSVYGRGKIIINDSVPGQDSYSDIKGYDSQAGQTLNFYVETNERPTCFYRSFPIYLE